MYVNLHLDLQFDSIEWLSVFTPIPCGFYYYIPVVQLQIKDFDAFRSSFIVQDSFSSPRLFPFPYVVENYPLNVS